MNDLELLVNFLARTYVKYKIKENEKYSEQIDVIIDGMIVFTFNKNRSFNFYEVKSIS